MGQVTRIGLDISKYVFQLHGVDAEERVVLRRKLRRRDVLAFFAGLEACEVGLEACGGAHYWARELDNLGHRVKLLPPQYVKAYRKRGKNDALDAEAICEAMSRPTMRFVAVKSAEAQAAQIAVVTRQRLIRERTRLSNTIRGLAAEFGLVVPCGLRKLTELLDRLQREPGLPELARLQFAELADEYAALEVRLERAEKRLMTLHRSSETSRRLARVPGIGPVGAVLLTIKSPPPEGFANGRQFAAWMGLTPKDHSTAGKTRTGVITRAGDETLRAVLVTGATSVINQVRRGKGVDMPWLRSLLQRKEPKEAAVALANKMARIAWKLMVSGESYRPERANSTAARVA